MTENVTKEREERKLFVVLIDVEKEETSMLTIDDDLDTYYKLLNCSTIDIVTREIGGKRFDIICDDEGTFKCPQKISAINDLGMPMLVGNLIICGEADKEGYCTSLSTDDALHIMKYVQNMSTINFPNGYPMLTQCEG